MKKNAALFAVCGVFVALAAFAVMEKSILGQWNVTYGNGAPGYAEFRKDGSCEATFTGQNRTIEGQYKEEGNTLSIAVNSCGIGYWATYKMSWVSDDSMQVIVMQDTCMGRKRTIDQSVLVRAK